MVPPALRTFKILEQQLEVIVLPLEDKVVLANLLCRSECYIFKLMMAVLMVCGVWSKKEICYINTVNTIYSTEVIKIR